MDFQTVLNGAVKKLVESGSLERRIEESLGKCVEEAVSQELRSYSDFGKMVQEAVKTSLNVKAYRVELPEYNDVKAYRVELPEYNDLVLKVVARQVDAALGATIERQVSENLKTILAAPPDEITVQQLVDEFKESMIRDCRCEGGEISVDIEESTSGSCSGYWHLYLDDKPDKKQYSCKYHIGIDKEGMVYSIQIGRNEADKVLFLGPYYGFDRLLFALKTNRTKVLKPESVYDLDLAYSAEA